MVSLPKIEEFFLVASWGKKIGESREFVFIPWVGYNLEPVKVMSEGINWGQEIAFFMGT